MLPEDIAQSLYDAVDAGFEEQMALTEEIIAVPSLRGNEAPAQDIIEREMKSLELETNRFALNVNELQALRGFSPVIDADYESATSVVGRFQPEKIKGKSLILNGHVDVVPAGPVDMWTRPPFLPYRKDGWIYGRGAGDMKSGVIANLSAFAAFKRAGLRPEGEVIVQSVIEEECTGNGMLSCLAKGYTAEAVVITEPMAEKLLRAQTGVLWFRVEVSGLPTHVSRAGEGSNAIEAAVSLMSSLRKIESDWNSLRDSYPPYEHIEHPINMNIGKIEGGDWPSSVPAWCHFEVRIAIYPGQDITKAKDELAATIGEASKTNPFLLKNPAKIVWHGFEAEGYVLKENSKAENVFAEAHRAVTGEKLASVITKATTDARFYGLSEDIPVLVYGARAERIHGFDERVNIASIRRLTKTLAYFMAEWCGYTKTESTSNAAQMPPNAVSIKLH